MPAALTHYSFALEVIKELKDIDIDAFTLGTQGPDPFFYRGILKKGRPSNYKDIWQIGENMHHSDVSPIYIKMLENAKGDKQLSSFVYGLFLHYCLDKIIHPYVFYRSGFDSNGGLEGRFKYNHGAFEALLDVRLSKLLKTYKNPGKTINVAKLDLDKISSLFNVVEDKNMTPTTYKESVIDFIGIEKLLFSRSGLKRILFRLTGKYSLAMAMSYPHFYKKADYFDVLNLKKSNWKDPSTLVMSNDSILDLFDKAKKEFIEFYPHLVNMDNDAIKSYCKELNHDGTPFKDKKREYSICFR